MIKKIMLGGGNDFECYLMLPLCCLYDYVYVYINDKLQKGAVPEFTGFSV